MPSIRSVLFIVIIIFTMSHLQYLPGPSNELLYTISFIAHAFVGALTITGVFGLPASLIVYFIFRNKHSNVAKWSILAVIIFASSMLSILFGGYVSKNYAQSVAADNAWPMINDIEQYKMDYGKYPEANNKAYSTGIIGIEPYIYQKYKDGYKISFRLNITVGINWDYLTYDPTGNTETTNGVSDVFITGRKGWYQYMGE